MNQTLYSDITLKYLAQNHSEFLESIDFKEDQSFDCAIKSVNGNRFFWIATYNMEITIGFENNRKECDWHFHIETSKENNQQEELKELTKELNKILNNEQVFILENERYIPVDKNQEQSLNGDNKFFIWDEI